MAPDARGRSSLRWRMAAWAAGIALVALASPAHSYVQVRVPGTATAALWRDPTIVLHWSPSDLPAGLSAAGARAALSAATAAWSQRSVPCTSVKFSLVEHPLALYGGVEDGTSTLVFHDRRFCKKGVARPGYCYDRRIAAMTSLHFDRRERAIREADIELNAVDFAFSVAAEERNEKSRRVIDLEHVLLHELGHMLGFGHACSREPSKSRAAHGGTVVACDSASARLAQSVMLPFADDIEGVRRASVRGPRDLPSFDRAGVCAVYPKR